MPVTIFFCYANQDEALLNKLKAHLKPWQKQGLIDVWHDREISAGTEWEQEISKHLNEAQIILLLISPDFMASDYVNDVELKRAVERHEQREALVIPIILRPANWKIPLLSGLQALPDRAVPVTLSHNRDAAFLSVANGIKRAIDGLTSQPTAQPSLGITQQSTRRAPQATKEQTSDKEAPKKEPLSMLPPRETRFKSSGVVLLTSVVVLIALGSVLVYVYIFLWPGHRPTTATTTHFTTTITTSPQFASSVNAPMFGFDAQHTHFNGGEHTLSPSSISRLILRWTVSIGGGVADTLFPSSPAVVNGVVYVGSWDHKLYAFKVSDCQSKPESCSPLWSAQIGGSIASSPAVANGVVYVGSYDGKLYAFKVSDCQSKPESCSPLWVSAQTGNSIFSSPVVDSGIVYVGSQDSKLYSYKASGCEGEKLSCPPLWSAQMGGSIASSPAVVNGVVYVGSWDHKLYALNASTGTLKWSYPTGNAIWSSPAVANGLVYFGSQDKKLYAIDAKTGALKWSYSTGDVIYSSPAVANGVVYVGSYDGKLYAFKVSDCQSKPESCSPLWVSAQTGGAFFSSPTVANSLVYIGLDNGTLYVYNASGCENGQMICDPLWISPSLGGPRLSSPTVVDGVVYLSSQDSKLYAFQLKA